ncbi:rhomboid family intramembrane serine protease [Pseudoxanthomonas sp. X-1]|uniref:rhomboid family intramembrane serine protease n=1 Tax=Pseudoxanthomonas sp. X-1 TaxID=2571115 RepID=UPI00110B1E85|nr:rhomboid family intramembrane serine protease [Pseudoxanthomonas sp. X-1]TMN20050.1 rhomboid family intramembrane serine protease [Pseudoxanthomonas sp. X-1]UAY76167.1 rhomboid family intramembrane serine protease [Pseudoxanthomonas sp. X-1]
MFPRLQPATQALLIANVAMFLLQMVMPEGLIARLLLWPIGAGQFYDGAGFMPWQLVTAGFMHAGLMHLFFNMLALWMFGSALEMVWGQKRFYTYYLVSLVGANVLQVIVGTLLLAQGQAPVPVLGASGAVFALLLGYGMLFPNQRMIVFPIPMEIKARTLVIIYGAMELFFAYTGRQPGVAHFVHLGGMLFGWLLIRYWRGQPPFKRGGGRGGNSRFRVVR